MNRYALLIALVFGLAACADEAVQGTEAAENCNEVQCPVGTSPVMESEAESACGGSAGVSRGLTDLDVNASAQCFGSGSCSLICEPPAACCGGEEWTDTSYKCETPCAAVCSCDGKCGTVTGADCEAECGDCSGGQVCSADNVCVDECPEGAEVCGDECFFPVDGDVCFNGEVCEAAKNCEGKACGSDGCGDICGTCPGSESCDNGQCVSDCKGSLPVCQGEVIQACQSTNPDDADAGWAWQDDMDCDTPGAETPYCAELASGATCVECNSDSDDQCGVGKACDLENGVCIDTCVPQCTNEGACMNGATPETDAEGNELSCVSDSDCDQGTCEGATKRYCGGDGCGAFCEGVDYSCNGNGNWCNTENGKCDTPLEECSFSFQMMVNGEPSDTWTKVVIPYGNPFCNSVVPDLGVILDDELPPEAVVSGQVLVNPDAPFENVCTWSIHEFDSGDKTKCGEQLCSMVQIPSDQNPIDYIKKTKLGEEDFCCKEPSSCEDFGVQEDQSFCNHADHPAFQTHKSDPWCAGDTPEPIEEGILLRCTQKGKVTEFKCEDCEEGDDGSWTSACSQEGWGCFEKATNGENGNCGPDGCDSSWPEGTVLGFCQEKLADFCDTEFMSSCSFEGGDAPTAYSTCSYDPTTNEISETQGAATCDPELVCVDGVLTDEPKPPCDGQACDPGGDQDGPWWKKPASATCEAPVVCPTNGESYDQYCNDPASPGYDDSYPESTILSCSVPPGVNTVYVEPADGDAWESCEDQGAICFMDANGNPSCQESQAGQCESTVPTCVEGGIESCVYDAASNTCECSVSPCSSGTIQSVCNNHTQAYNWQTGQFEYALLDDATCEPANVCPFPTQLPTSSGKICNDPDASWHQADLATNAVIQCYAPSYNSGLGVNFVEWTVAETCQGSQQCYPYEGETAAKCMTPPVCEKDSWCSENLQQSWTCNADSNTGQKDEFSKGCGQGEQCAWVGAGGVASPAEGTAEAEGKADCVDMSCGPASDNGIYQAGCYDHDDTCWLGSTEPNPQGDNAFYSEGIAQKVFVPGCEGDSCDDGWVASHACLPDTGCPTGAGTLTIDLNGAGTIQEPISVTWVQNDAPGDSYYFASAEPGSPPGFLFACLELDEGPFYPVMDGILEGIHAPLPEGEPGLGQWGVKPSHCAGHSQTDIECCMCAHVMDLQPINGNGPWHTLTSALTMQGLETACKNECDTFQ